jgi:DNA-binding beta-propeller fold protein YncE
MYVVRGSLASRPVGKVLRAVVNMLALAVLVAGSPPTGASLPLNPVADVPLPGHASRFDYQAVDSTGRRLYIAHLGDSSLVAFDLDGQRVLREIPGLPSVHGVAVAPDRHLIFATATAEKTLALIDDATFDVRARVPAGEYPNGLAYDPGSGRVFVSNNTGIGVGVVDVAAARALPGIDIGGGAGNAQLDADSGHVLFAVHGRPYLADVDPVSSRVASRIGLGALRGCHGLLVASGLHLAFAACHGSGPSLAVVDLGSRAVTATLSLPVDVDVLAFDPGLGRLYAASEPGVVAVFAVAADRSVTPIGRGFVGPNAHSVAVDPATHRVYFPLADLGGRPVLRVMDARTSR